MTAFFLPLTLSAMLFLVVQLIYKSLVSPLRCIPGPLLAQFTNLWRFLDVWRGGSIKTLIELHDQYGTAVRLGPNRVSLNEPDLIRTVYSTRNRWIKSDMYKVNDFVSDGKTLPTVFSARDEEWHTAMTKHVNRLYSLTSVIRFEHLIDNSINVSIDHLYTRFLAQGKSCPMHKWLHYMAWEIISRVTFDRHIGFMQDDSDKFSLIAIGEQSSDYFTLVSQMPWLDLLLDKNPIVQSGPPSFSAFAKFGTELIMARRTGKDGHDATRQRDLLDEFLEIERNDGSVTSSDVLTWTMTPVVAGSDTVAIELRAVMYYLCKDLSKQRKLQAELDAANFSTVAQWSEIVDLPYLDAVAHEALRLHPATGLPLERIIPDSGLVLSDGRYLAPGTVVGMNPWVLQRNVDVYGADVDQFKPERWLKQEDELPSTYQRRLSRMRDTLLTFGFGKRMCSGRHLALVEIYKVIATLFSRFKFQLKHEHQDWTIESSWFVRQRDMDVILLER